MNQMMKFIFRKYHYIRYALRPAVLLFAAINCCAQLYPHEGYVDVKGGKIWYRVIGSGNKTPLLLLHGGPGGELLS